MLVPDTTIKRTPLIWLLQGTVSSDHQAAIREWLDTYGDRLASSDNGHLHVEVIGSYLWASGDRGRGTARMTWGDYDVNHIVVDDDRVRHRIESRIGLKEAVMNGNLAEN